MLVLRYVFFSSNQPLFTFAISFSNIYYETLHFLISIQLTDAGLENVNEVVAIVFKYLEILRTAGPQEWIHEETSTVADCNFRFLSKRNPID